MVHNGKKGRKEKKESRERKKERKGEKILASKYLHTNPQEN